MATNTPRFGLGRFDEGENGWDHTDTVNLLDEYSINRGPIADRPTSGDYDDQMYYATDQGLLWRWDSTASDWTTDNFGTDTEPVPGTSYFNELFSNGLTTGDIDANNVNGDAFGLPSGWTLTENNDGEAVFEDSGGNVVLRRDATNGEWVTDTVNANSISTDALEATAELGNPTYPTLADVPTNLPEGTQVYVADENQLYVEDGT